MAPIRPKLSDSFRDSSCVNLQHIVTVLSQQRRDGKPGFRVHHRLFHITLEKGPNLAPDLTDPDQYAIAVQLHPTIRLHVENLV